MFTQQLILIFNSVKPFESSNMNLVKIKSKSSSFLRTYLWLTTYNIYITSISWKIKIYPTLQVRIITSSALNVNPVSPKIFVPSIIVSELCFFEFDNGRCSMSSNLQFGSITDPGFHLSEINNLHSKTFFYHAELGRFGTSFTTFFPLIW